MPLDRPLTASDSDGSSQLPTFGALLRTLRDQRRVSRERLGFAVGVSASYLAHLERGHRDRPTAEVVEALVRWLDRVEPLTPAIRRHLYELAGLAPHSVLPPAADLATAVSQSELAPPVAYEPAVAVYLDVRGNVLTHNESFAMVFRGVSEQRNLVHWTFGNPLAKQVLVEWEREAKSTAALIRGSLGQFGRASFVLEVLEELDAYPDFRRMWALETVGFGRDRPLLVRDLDTDDTTSLYMNFFRVDSDSHQNLIGFLLGVRHPG